MPCFLTDPPVAYFPVPKCGCTSIKYVWYKIENKRDFTMCLINGKRRHIHTFYGTDPFRKEYYKQFGAHAKVAIIRDPLNRLLSAYCNRVLRYKELGHRDQPSTGMDQGRFPAEPDIDEFALYLKYYLKGCKSIAHHLAPFSYYLGKDLEWYDHLLKFEDFEKIRKTFSAVCRQELEFPDIQHSPTSIDPGHLKAKTLDIFMRYLKSDYRYLKNYYSL